MRFNKLDVPFQWKEQFTKYPHGYSIFEAMSKWVKQVNDMITNINQWNEYLGGFTSTFGEVPPQMAELQREMEALLSSVNSDLTNIMGEVTGLADTLLTHLNEYATFKNSKGQPSGLATLGEDGKVQAEQLPEMSGGEWTLIKDITITESISALEVSIDENGQSIDKKYKEFLIIGTIKRTSYTSAKAISVNTLGLANALTTEPTSHTYIRMWIESKYHFLQGIANRAVSTSSSYNFSNGTAWRKYDDTSGQEINYSGTNPTFKKISITFTDAVDTGSVFKIYGR